MKDFDVWWSEQEHLAQQAQASDTFGLSFFLHLLNISTVCVTYSECFKCVNRRALNLYKIAATTFCL